MQGLEPFFTALGAALLQFLWQGVAIALLAWIALVTVPRTDSTARHAIGLGALLASLCVFAGTFVLALVEARAAVGAAAGLSLEELPLATQPAGA